MSTAEIPTGYVGNLSKDQEAMLKQMWATFFALNDKVSSSEKASALPAADLAEVSKHFKEHGFAKFQETFWRSPSADDPDAMMLRFLRARKWDVKAAFNMFVVMLKWRIDLKVDQIVEDGEEGLNKDLKGFDFQMKSGKSYLHGTDKKNRPVFYIHVQIHLPSQQTFEALRTFTIYSMETGRLVLVPPTNQTCLVFDMTNFGLKNMDWPFIQFLVKAFEAYYPETLGLIAIHNAPWVFSGIWRVLRPLLDPVVQNKITFTRSTKELLEYIDADQLPKGLGGEEDWTWTYTDVVPGENSRIRDAAAHKEHLGKRAAARAEVEATTKAWIASNDETIKTARDKAILEYRITSLETDPYVRPRTVYHRQNNVLEDGSVEWKYKSSAGDQKVGVSVAELKSRLEALGGPSTSLSEKPGAQEVLNGHVEPQAVSV